MVFEALPFSLLTPTRSTSPTRSSATTHGTSSDSGRNRRIDDSSTSNRFQDRTDRDAVGRADDQDRAASDGSSSGGRFDSGDQFDSGGRFGSSGSGADSTDTDSQQGSGASRAGSRANGASRGSGSKRTSRTSGSNSTQSKSNSAVDGPADQNGTDFSHTLSQSLAAAAQSNTSASAADSADGSDSRSGTDGDASKADPGSDPVSLALALVTQALAGMTPAAQAAARTAATVANATAGLTGTPIAADGIEGSGAGGAASANAAKVAAGAGLFSLGKGAEAVELETSQSFATLLGQAAATDSSSPGLGTSDGTTNGHLTINPTATDASATGTLAPNLQLGTLSHFAAAHSATDANATSAELKTPVGTQGWSDELGGHITWMTDQGLESASLKLSPDHLGPLQVQISVRDGAASVLFGAHHADTRTAIEQALPRLRELFANQGLTLADAGVSREPPRGQQSRTPRVTSVTSTSAVGSNETSVTTAAISRLGLVDTYA